MKSVHALIVDDNDELADNLCSILDTLPNYDVKCLIARSTQEGLERARAEGSALDIALIDLTLPDGDGMSLVPRLRDVSPFLETIIVTGNASLESAVAAVGKGAFAYVVKPFTPQELLATAGRALAQVELFRERELLRAELERSEARHRGIVEAIPAFVVALDGDGRIALWNRALELATHFGREEMLGKRLELNDDERDFRLPTKQGGHRLVQWKHADVADQRRGSLRYYMGLDVTDEREMLRRSLRAERLAAVGTLAAGLAHEVRNPLNSASLQLQVLQRRLQRGDENRDSLLSVVGVVESEIRRLDRLVNEFLAFARPAPLELRSTPINDLVSTVVELVRLEADAVGIELVVELTQPSAYVDAEPERLRQVILNLVRNGIEAMPNGGTLTVRTLPVDDHGNLSLEVIDTGIGFTDDSPIFDAFYTTKASGTGLGLAIVHRIVGDHGGVLRAKSEPERTCFTVLLPARAGGPPSSRPALSRA